MQRRHEGPPRENPLHRMEGASPTLRAISANAGETEEGADRAHRRCPGTRRVHLGDRLLGLADESYWLIGRQGKRGRRGDGQGVGAGWGNLSPENWERQLRSPRVRPRQPHDAYLACGSQPANKKLLNRRESAGALTLAPMPRNRCAKPRPSQNRAEATRSHVSALAKGHKNFGHDDVIAGRSLPYETAVFRIGRIGVSGGSYEAICRSGCLAERDFSLRCG